MDVVTFTITLPTGGGLEEYTKALRLARNSQQQLGNPSAAHALHCVLTLAEKGLSDINVEASRHIVAGQGGLDP